MPNLFGAHVVSSLALFATWRIFCIALSAVGKLSYHTTRNLTFEKAKESCQREGKDIFTDLGFLVENRHDVVSSMKDNHMSVAWMGNNILSHYWGR